MAALAHRGQASILALDNEVQATVLSKLSSARDLCNAELTCRSWQELCASNDLWPPEARVKGSKSDWLEREAAQHWRDGSAGVRFLHGHTCAVEGLSVWGNTLASLSSAEVCLWNLRTGAQRRVISAAVAGGSSRDPSASRAVLALGDDAVAATCGRQVVFWRGGAVQRRFDGGLQRTESHLTMHDMQLYVGSAQSPDVAVYDLYSGSLQQLWRPGDSRAPLTSLEAAELEGHQVLVTCHSDGTVRVLDAASGQVIAALQTGGLSQARCAPGHKLVVQRGRGDMMCLDLRLASQSPSMQLVPGPVGSRCVLWSSYPHGVQGRAETAPWSLAVPARGSVVAGQERGHSTMHLFDLDTGDCLRQPLGLPQCGRRAPRTASHQPGGWSSLWSAGDACDGWPRAEVWRPLALSDAGGRGLLGVNSGSTGRGGEQGQAAARARAPVAQGSLGHGQGVAGPANPAQLPAGRPRRGGARTGMRGQGRNQAREELPSALPWHMRQSTCLASGGGAAMLVSGHTSGEIAVWQFGLQRERL